MTRDEADVLEVDSERLSSDVNNAELDLETYEQTAAEDQRLADEVRTMLGGGGGGNDIPTTEKFLYLCQISLLVISQCAK